MAEEIIENENTEEVTAADYLSNLQAVKDNMVSKDAYNKLQAENKQLADALMNGEFMKPEAPKETVDVKALRNKLYTNTETYTSDLEYFEDTMKLRSALIEAGEPDPFLPTSHDYIPTGDDLANAERAAKGIQECIDYADGDNEVFLNELKRRCNIKSKLK